MEGFEGFGFRNVGRLGCCRISEDFCALTSINLWGDHRDARRSGLQGLQGLGC